MLTNNLTSTYFAPTIHYATTFYAIKPSCMTSHTSNTPYLFYTTWAHNTKNYSLNLTHKSEKISLSLI